VSTHCGWCSTYKHNDPPHTKDCPAFKAPAAPTWTSAEDYERGRVAGRREALEEAARMLETQAMHNDAGRAERLRQGDEVRAAKHEAVAYSRRADATRIRAMVKR
jgi:hypothetical protein